MSMPVRILAPSGRIIFNIYGAFEFLMKLSNCECWSFIILGISSSFTFSVSLMALHSRSKISFA